MTDTMTALRATKPNRLAQALLSQVLVERNRSVAGRLIARQARQVRKLWSAHGDPLIAHQVAGRDLVLPLSHDLPIILATWPHYATNLVRLAAMTVAARENTAIVDIGANVGDSVVLMRKVLSAPILCVEGDEVFLDLLRRNVRDFEDVKIEEAFVAATEGDPDRSQSIRRQAGTAALIPSNSGLPLTRPVRPLSEILSANPGFLSPGFIKVDTDGADAQIIVRNKELLARTRPVVFFEFDPLLAARFGDKDPYRAMDALEEAGYRAALVYANTGELMLASRVTDTSVWRDLGRYALARGPGHYYDIAAFHADDQELFEHASAAERDFFDNIQI